VHRLLFRVTLVYNNNLVELVWSAFLFSKGPFQAAVEQTESLFGGLSDVAFKASFVEDL